VLNKGSTGTIFITSLVWRGPWLGIEPGSAGGPGFNPQSRTVSFQRSYNWSWYIKSKYNYSK